MKDEIIELLKLNGYSEGKSDDEYIHFYKNGCSDVDINEKEIVLVSDMGDWLHIPLNKYALLGALIHHRQLAIDYKS